MHSFFITGTDTDVGKTYITAQLCNMFRQAGFDVGVMKPVSTGGRADARYLLKETYLKDPIDLVNPIHFKPPVAPTIAANLAGQSINIRRIFSCYKKLKAIHKDGILVEGAGGLMVPLAKNYILIDLIKDLKIPVIIVARPSLGTINHTLLTINMLKSIKAKISGFLVNYNLPDSISADFSHGLTAKFSPGIIEMFSGVKEIDLESIKKRLAHARLIRGRKGASVLFH